MISPPMMKQDSIPPTTTNNHQTLQPTNVCGQCGIEEHKLLHHVRLRNNFRRLCTTCVLRLHPQCFCPSCLGVYDRSPPDDAVVCYKCYSASHSTCVVSPPAGTVRGPSTCMSCLNPGLLVLNLSRVESGARVIDGNAARLLLAAGKIAAMSMSKAEVAAAMEAERRAKEAAYTKKRAREALDHVVRLMGREPRNVVESRKISHLGMPVVVEGNVVGNKVDESSEVLKALDLKDNGLQTPVIVDKSVVFESQGDGVVGMEVDVSGNDLAFDSVAEIGGVKNNDELVKSVENGEEQVVEKIVVMVESNVSNPLN